jgi:hypothetical protein
MKLEPRVARLEKKHSPKRALNIRVFVHEDGAPTGTLDGKTITLDEWDAMQEPGVTRIVVKYVEKQGRAGHEDAA